MTDHVSVQQGNWRTGADRKSTSVRIEIDGALANDLSALLLTLPEESFARFRLLSTGLDRFISGHTSYGTVRE